jgi:hypothetical protein
LIEDPEHYSSSWVYAQECLRSVLRVYERALALPELDFVGSEPAPNRIEHQEWEQVRKKVGERLCRDYYWEVFEPLEKDPPEPLTGSISDDLTDIWRDLKVGMTAFERGTPPDMINAFWHWRFSLETHWARHVAGVVSALTAVCFGTFADESRPASARDRQ